MGKIGQVQFVQIQTSSLKQGEKPDRYYDPTAILKVNHLVMTDDGVIGVTENGSNIIDVHNVLHQESRHRGGNGITIGFSSHYETMRAKFDDHLSDGIAGENIIIKTDGYFTPEKLGKRITFVNADTEESITLDVMGAVAPCSEFSHFCANTGHHRLPPDQLKDILQFLDNGKRGIFLEVGDSDQRPVIQSGDHVFIED